MNASIRFFDDPLFTAAQAVKPQRPNFLNQTLLAAATLLSVFALAGIAAADTPASGSYGGGSGTDVDPWQISTLAELRKFMEAAPLFQRNSFYKLTANIDAADTNTWLGGAGWLPVDAGLMQGFDGQNFAIQNLFVNRPTEDQVGFFKTFGGLCCREVKNVHLIGGQITGRDNVGALVGMASSFTTISNSSSTAMVSGRSMVGGLAGVVGGTSVTGSSASGSVTATSDFVGGLIGQALGTTVASSSATGHVTGVKATGGLIGTYVQGSAPALTTTFATGKVDGYTHVGGLIGESTGKVTFSYATGMVTATGNDTSQPTYTFAGGLIGIQDNHGTEDSWASGAVSGPFSGVGGLIGSNGGPVLRTATIAGQTVSGGASAGSVGGLIGDNKGAITSSRSASAVNASGATVESIGGLVGISAGGSGITNSYATGNVTAAAANKVGGLIGWHTTGGISGSHAHGDVSGSSNVGGLIGLSTTPIVSTSYATGSVLGATLVGGLIGNRGSGTTDTTFATGDVTATGDYVGGLIGFNSGAIKKSYANPGTVSGNDRVGGLVGNSQGSIETSYAIKTVTGINFVGGLVGQSATNSFGVRDCYAKGSVTGSDKVGGLVGRNEAASNIAQCYASGSVTLSGAGSIGALVGDNQAAANANNYWNTSTTARPAIGAGTMGATTGLTSVQMKQQLSFTGFNFSSPWRIDQSVSEPYFDIGGTLDIDHSMSQQKYDALTDGVLAVRYLFGLTGDALASGALGNTAARTDPIAIKNYLDGIRPLLDVDGSGNAYAMTDGLLVVRYLLGLSGDALISGAVDMQNGTRTTALKIQNYLQSLTP